MWELDNKDGWALKNWCFWTVMLENSLESPLDCKEIQPVNPEIKQPWILIGRTEAEAPTLWPPNRKSQLTRKDPDAGKDWRQEKGMTEDDIIGWYHWFNGHEFEQTLIVKDREAWHAKQDSMGSQRVGYNWVTEQQLHVALLQENKYLPISKCQDWSMDSAGVSRPIHYNVWFSP